MEGSFDCSILANKAFHLFLELLDVQTGYLRERSKLLMSEIIDIYIAVIEGFFAKTIFGPFICKFMCSMQLWILVHATRRVFPVSLDGLYFTSLSSLLLSLLL